MESQRDTAKGKQKAISPNVPIQQDFLFVDSSKSAKGSRQGRRSARSFVMQRARRERPWSTSKHGAKQRKTPETTSPKTDGSPDLSHTPNTSTPSPPGSVGAEHSSFADSSSFHLVKQDICLDCQIFLCRPGQSLCPRCLLLQAPAPADELDNGLFDPFTTVPIAMNRKVSELLDHFVSEMAPSTIAVDIRRTSKLMRSDWFGTAMSSSGFMHSLLCTAALHLFFVGRGSVDTILYHKAQAIAAINAAISDPDPKLGISDANIGAVFNLLCVEETLGSPYFQQAVSEEDPPNQREIHLNGMLRMVQLRGGLTGINSNRILQAFILWHSTAHAIATFQPPYLHTVDFLNAERSPHHTKVDPPNIPDHLLDCCRTVEIKDSLAALVQKTLVLIADLNVWFGDPNSSLDPLDLQNYACVLEIMLLQWHRENEHLTNPIEDGLCVALLIFAVRVTAALQRRSEVHSLHSIATKRLEKALSATSRDEWVICPDLLLWILAIGAISAEGSPEYSWFSYQVSLACQNLGIFSADALVDRLHLCGWVSFKLNDAVYVLWDKIIHLRHEPYLDHSYTVGPFQNKVSEPDFTDWQNIGWGTMINSGDGPAEGPSLRGDERLYDLGISHAALPMQQPLLYGFNWRGFQ